MNYSAIHLDLDTANVATLTLNRPDNLNALNFTLLDEMRHALIAIAERGARALLLAGAGRGFSSGADLGGSGGFPEDVGAALEAHFNPLIQALFELPMPVVAAVNGPCAGAGCSLALCADIVIAGRSAYFLQAFVNIGLIPDAGATWLLPRLAGRARAMEMMMLGERVSAEQALDWGMISRVVADEDLLTEAKALTARLAAGPTAAYALIRKLARNSAHLGLAEALAAERIAQREAGRTEDFKQGVVAFLQKRPPSFDGR